MNDYYIAQTCIQDTYPDKIDDDVEKRGQEGVNKYIYWVSNDILEDWIELPLITPKHIK